MNRQHNTAAPGSALNGRETAQIVGIVTALAAMTTATPQLIITALEGVLWSKAETLDLLEAVKVVKPLDDRIFSEFISGHARARHPNQTVL